MGINPPLRIAETVGLHYDEPLKNDKNNLKYTNQLKKESNE